MKCNKPEELFVSIDLPADLSKEFNEFCKKNYISKKRFFIDAVIEQAEEEGEDLKEFFRKK